MKKYFLRILSAVTACALAFSCFIFSGAEGTPGDVDGDGEINSADALAVLRHSVGLELLGDAKFVLADVNSDGGVNSSDALEILSYSVGLIKEFSGSRKMTDEEAFRLYRTALVKARAEKPSYVSVRSNETKDVHVEISGLGSEELFKNASRETEQNIKDKGTRRYYGAVPKGSAKSAEYLPQECAVDDVSKLESITFSKNKDGSVKIDIKFKKETNPGADSVLVKALGVRTFEQVKSGSREITESVTLDGLKNKLQITEVSYDNCYVSCVVNPENSEFVSLEWNVDAEIGAEASAGAVKMSIAVTQSENSKHSNFGY